MITFAHLIILALVRFGALPSLALVIVPLYYIWWIGRALIKGGAEVDPVRLTSVLANRWKNPQELATYMVRYWTALKYSSSAGVRQRTCTSLALIQLAVGVLVLWKASIIVAAVMITEGAVLWFFATQVNRPLSMYKDDRVRLSKDEFCRNEWCNAVSALIAYAEIYPDNGNARFIAAHLLADEQAVNEISAVRIPEKSAMN